MDGWGSPDKVLADYFHKNKYEDFKYHLIAGQICATGIVYLSLALKVDDGSYRIVGSLRSVQPSVNDLPAIALPLRTPSCTRTNKYDALLRESHESWRRQELVLITSSIFTADNYRKEANHCRIGMLQRNIGEEDECQAVSQDVRGAGDDCPRWEPRRRGADV